MALTRLAMTRPRAAGLTLAISLALSACTGQSLSPVESYPQGFAPWSDGLSPYHLGPGDHFLVKYRLLPDLDDEATVAPDGTAGLRMAGQVDAAGLTSAELAQEIETKSKRWMRDPQVTVALRETPSNKVFVGGSVQHPGPFPLSGRMGAMEAILLAGGFNDEARYDEVVLIRRSPDNKPMLRTINLRDFIQTGGAPGDVPLASGDILFVPRSSIAETDLWVEQFINRVVPFQRSFSYTIGRQRSTSQ